MAAAIQKLQIQTEDNQPRQSTCLGCRIKFDNVELQRAHFKTEWHSYNLKRRVCNLEPIDLNSFNLIQAAAPVKHTNLSSKTNSSQVSVADDDDANWDDVDVIDDEELLDEEFNEEEAAEMLARVIKADCCLFCDKKSANMEKNIAHMDLLHGFFIPENQYVIDLEGLMEYLGFKVGAGATCIWCNKQFKSLHGVRLHMLYKDHCKIKYDHEVAIDEFKEFYDYSTQEKFDMKPRNQLVIVKKRPERRQTSTGRVGSLMASANSNQIVTRRGNLSNLAGNSVEAKTTKKFNATRAKILLRTGMANNYNFRHRIRQQNPI